MSIVLGLSAKIKTGKSFIGTSFAESVGWNYVSFGDYVRLITEQRGLPAKREVWQRVGEEMIKQGLKTFCRGVISQIPNWRSGDPLVVDGVRHIEISNVLREIVAPSKYILVSIIVDEKTRLERVFQEEEKDIKSIERIEAHSTEIQVKNSIPQIADYIIDGNKSLPEIIKELKLISSEK